MDPAESWSKVDHAALRGAAEGAARAEAVTLNAQAAAAAVDLRGEAVSRGALTAAARLADFAAVALAIWFAQYAALEPLAFAPGRAAGVALGLAAAAVAVGEAARLYRLSEIARFWTGGLAACAAATAILAIAGVVGLFGEDGAATAIVGAGFAAAALAPGRAACASVTRWCLSAGATERRAALVGGGGNADKLLRGLAGNPENDIRIVGFFDDRGDDRSPPIPGCRKLGTVAELVEFARIARVDMVIVTLPLSAEKRILQLLRSLWVLPVEIRLSAYSADYSFPRQGDGALIDVLRRPLGRTGSALKRALDVLGAAAALVALSPVMLATALAIRLDSPGPVVFRQQRHGYNHRPIEVLKFRSMRADQCDPEARSIVVKGDPRVTRVGRFIRRTSIDELPQLFNVLRGDLSLVGPRPHALEAMSSKHQMFTEIVEGYSGRHKVPPGITGWAQVNGWRGEVDDPDKLRKRFECDVYYIENWSLWLDLRILLRTPLSLLKTDSAY